MTSWLRKGLVACATLWLATRALAATGPATPEKSSAPASASLAGQGMVLGFPRDIAQVYAIYEKAFADHNFGALTALLAPDFATYQEGRGFSGHDQPGWQGRDKSRRDLREMFDFGQNAPRSGPERDRVQLERVDVSGPRASVWLRQVVGFTVRAHGISTTGCAKYELREDWLRTAAGWRLRRAATAPMPHAPVSLTLY